MSTTPNQKDLLAKKSDLEGILKPDDNDVLHLPDVTITLAESGQFYLAGIDKKLLTLVGNTSGNAVTLDGDAGLTFTTSGGSSTITGITSSNGNSTSLAASQSMASAKQDKIIAGTNIQIAQDGKTISATDTNELENLTDVNITTPTDGQGLVYNNTTQKWENGTVSSASSIDTLTDVNLTNLTNGQILKYNSTSQEWENADESGGGGGTSKYTEEVLWSGNESTSRWVEPIVLNIDITDYDMLSIRCGASNETGGVHIILTSKIPSGGSSGGGTVSLGTFTDSQYSIWLNKDDNILRIFTSTGVSINVKEVVGIKYGSGGGEGGSTFEGLDYANKTSLNIPDATGYTYTPTENGALLLTGYGSASVICESTSELLHLKPYDDTYSTVWVLIEKNVTYTIKKGGGSGSSFGSGSVLYFIPLKNSSSSGSSQIDALWEGSAAPSVNNAIAVNLTHDIDDYDYILVNVKTTDQTYPYHSTCIYKPPFNINDLLLNLADGNAHLYCYLKINSLTNINLQAYNSQWGAATTYTGIYGVKTGGGGSSVTPNPTDPATDALTSIEIDGTVYSVGGGEGYTEEVIYSATPTTAAPNTLTLTKPYTDFDMLLFNLYRSADGVMNKYDRVVLTSKLSLNDRIQLITYNEWASYDITTTTSFTLINENRMYIGSVVGLKFGEGGGSGGSSEVTYSTTEHKVGTWIDGSDVYEKTISISNVSLSSGSYETVDTITGLDTIISCNGYVVEGNLKYTLNDITLRVIQDGTSVKFYSPSGTTWTISSGAIIIRYTKVTSS